MLLPTRDVLQSALRSERDLADRLAEALRRAEAAVWDAYYGKGLSVEYARAVGSEITTALRAHEEARRG